MLIRDPQLQHTTLSSGLPITVFLFVSLAHVPVGRFVNMIFKKIFLFTRLSWEFCSSPIFIILAVELR